VTAGDWYYNTTASVTRIYDGSVWQNGAVSTAGFLLAGNDLSDLNDAATSRTNLGVAIGTDVQAYSAVLAATTASFTTADETKLDGIETAATADQTAQEIATAIDADATAETTLKSALGLGTAAYTASTDYATAAQGALADSATQPGDNISTLTNDSGYITGEFASGTRMVFAQASAPTGWTQDTTSNADNRMLRVVNSTGNGVGGSNSPILMDVVPAHTHSFTTGNNSVGHTHSGTTGTISANHTHSGTTSTKSLTGSFTNIYTGASGTSVSGIVSASILANNTGGSGSTQDRWNFSINASHNHTMTTGTVSANHTHAFTTGDVSANHTHSGTTDNGSSSTNWTPKYIDMIICSKD